MVRFRIVIHGTGGRLEPRPKSRPQFFLDNFRVTEMLPRFPCIQRGEKLKSVDYRVRACP